MPETGTWCPVESRRYTLLGAVIHVYAKHHARMRFFKDHELGNTLEQRQHHARRQQFETQRFEL